MKGNHASLCDTQAFGKELMLKLASLFHFVRFCDCGKKVIVPLQGYSHPFLSLLSKTSPYWAINLSTEIKAMWCNLRGFKRIFALSEQRNAQFLLCIIIFQISRVRKVV